MISLEFGHILIVNKFSLKTLRDLTQVTPWCKFT